MSINAMNWAFQQNLPPAEKLVLLALADHHNGGTGLCIPGQKLLAEQASMSVRSVQRHLADLEERGLISRRARFRSEGRGRTSDAYSLSFVQGDNLAGNNDPLKLTKATNQDDQHDTRVVAITGREPEDKTLATSSRKKVNDGLFDKIAEVCGYDTSTLTKSARGQLNKAVKELREVGADADQVGGKAAAYKEKYPGMDLTPTALIKHWAALYVRKVEPRQSAWDTYDPPERYYS